VTEDKKEILIEGFLSGSLSQDDRATLQRLALEDDVFLDNLKRAKAAKDLLLVDRSRTRINEEFEKYLERNSSRDEVPDSKRRPFDPMIYWKIAASIVIIALAAIGGFYYFSSPETNNASAAREYFTPYSVVEAIPTMGSESDDAYRDYENGAYESSIEKFKTLLGHGGKRDRYIRFYLANAQLATNQFGDAEQNFRTILDSDQDFPLRSQAKWYLALSYLMHDKQSKAMPLIDELLTDEQYQLKAASLKQRIYATNQDSL
jgi:predicted negative regulator of RcsB-dependent stress response